MCTSPGIYPISNKLVIYSVHVYSVSATGHMNCAGFYSIHAHTEKAVVLLLACVLVQYSCNYIILCYGLISNPARFKTGRPVLKTGQHAYNWASLIDAAATLAGSF